MRIFLKLLGSVLAILGGIWILQGINLLPGSFMTGQLQWAAYGALALAVGAALLFAARKLRKPDPPR